MTPWCRPTIWKSPVNAKAPIRLIFLYGMALATGAFVFTLKGTLA